MKVTRPTAQNSPEIQHKIAQLLCEYEYIIGIDKPEDFSLAEIKSVAGAKDGKEVADILKITDDCDLQDLNELDGIFLGIYKIIEDTQKKYFYLINYKPKYQVGDEVNCTRMGTPLKGLITKIDYNLMKYHIKPFTKGGIDKTTYLKRCEEVDGTEQND